MAALKFDLQHQSTKGASRAGTITTDHGSISTPIFMPVGTIGSVKAVTQQQLKTTVNSLCCAFLNRFLDNVFDFIFLWCLLEVAPGISVLIVFTTFQSVL